VPRDLPVVVSSPWRRSSPAPSPTAACAVAAALAAVTATQSPSSLGSGGSAAATPDDDGTNPVDFLDQLNIFDTSCEFDIHLLPPPSGASVDEAACDEFSLESLRGATADRCVASPPHGGARGAASSSASSTGSRDSARSEPDAPITPARGSTVLQQQQQPRPPRYVRRPSHLPLAGTIQLLGTSQHVGKTAAAAAAACCRRIARRRMRSDAFPAAAAVVSPGAPLLPPLPSAAEMAYLRSVCARIAGAPPPTAAAEQDARTRAPASSTAADPPAVSAEPVGSGRTAVQTASPGTAGLDAAVSVTSAWSSETAADAARQRHHAHQHHHLHVQQQQQQQQRLYGCSVTECGKLYSKSSHLKAHMRSHTGTYRLTVEIINRFRKSTNNNNNNNSMPTLW